MEEMFLSLEGSKRIALRSLSQALLYGSYISDLGFLLYS